MKLKLNKRIILKDVGTHVLAIYPNGINVKFPKYFMELIQAFNPPAEPSEVQHSFSKPPHQVKHDVDQLQDQNILVPADDLIRPHPLPPDLLHEKDDTFRKFFRMVKGYTMGTPAICYALYQAVRYICSAGIDGAIVETGVWRGGSLALCALTLLELDDASHDLYLFDTFDWSWPDLLPVDTTLQQPSVEARNARFARRRNVPQEQLDAELVSEERVCEYLLNTGYPAEKVFTEKGFVQDTIPDKAPAKIALLRLDTDLYESTYHELVHLYPRLVSGGILLIDDYPTEHGVIRAVEQYFSEEGSRPFLSRIDLQGRIGVKP